RISRRLQPARPRALPRPRPRRRPRSRGGGVTKHFRYSRKFAREQTWEEYMSREVLAGPFETERGYSPVIKTVGGTHIWVAGQTGHRGADGKSLNRDIESQTR